MEKILYIVPHLSTGGMPQYVLKQIEYFKINFLIQLVEYNNYSNDYVVQKNKIKSLIPVHTLKNDKNELLNIIKDFNPNIIHFQEIPENFVDLNVLKQIYNINREYKIVVTTHSSLINPLNLTFLADKFILVNLWSKQQFEKTGIDCDIWEYPIEYKKKEKNILNIGLFTPGKNQREIFEIAKHLPEYKFHFVGNQAINFKEYWEPLMNSKPENCICWGEKENVEDFYKQADIFYFSSKFELNPIVIKEAISYNLPILMYKLEQYLDDYDNNPLIHYINNLSIENKIHLLKQL